MTYIFTKSPIAYDRLELEIRQSTIVTALDYMTGAGTTTTIYFKANLSEADVATLNTIVQNHTGLPLPQNVVQEVRFSSVDRTPTGIIKTATYEAEGDGATIVSHDFSNKCSWFQFSVAMTKEALVNSVGNTFESATGKNFWVKLVGGTIYDEDNILLQNPDKYDIKVYIDDVLQLANTYTINHAAGSITFNDPVAGAVTATYRYADKSYYMIKPNTGKTLSIKEAEVQFSTGTILQAPFIFEAWATISHPLYGVIQVQVPGTAISYKNAKDFISACNQGQGVIPKWGELTRDVHVFPFHYARPKPMKASQNVEIRVYCKNHLPLDSEFGTATFYVTVDSEV